VTADNNIIKASEAGRKGENMKSELSYSKAVEYISGSYRIVKGLLDNRLSFGPFNSFETDEAFTDFATYLYGINPDMAWKATEIHMMGHGVDYVRKLATVSRYNRECTKGLKDPMFEDLSDPWKYEQCLLDPYISYMKNKIAKRQSLVA